MQMSTPMVPLQTPGMKPNMAGFSTPFPPQSTMSQNNNTEESFSPIHNALFLHLGRILRPVWFSPLLKESSGNPSLDSMLSSKECSYLARQVELLAIFINGSPVGGTGYHRQPFGDSHDQSRNRPSSEEAGSIAALCLLLQHTLQILRLWMLLTHHQFPTVIAALPKVGTLLRPSYIFAVLLYFYILFKDYCITGCANPISCAVVGLL